jgi:hypothetical protein
MAQKLQNKAISNPISGPSLLQRRQQNEQCTHSSSQPHLNFANVARHNAGKDTYHPLPLAQHTRSGRHSMTRHGREAEHDARSLSGPHGGDKRSLSGPHSKDCLHVAGAWRARMKLGAHPLHVKPPRTLERTLDELERGIDLVSQPLADGNAPNPAEEAIVIFESQGSASRP